MTFESNQSVLKNLKDSLQKKGAHPDDGMRWFVFGDVDQTNQTSLGLNVENLFKEHSINFHYFDLSEQEPALELINQLIGFDMKCQSKNLWSYKNQVWSKNKKRLKAILSYGEPLGIFIDNIIDASREMVEFLEELKDRLTGLENIEELPNLFVMIRSQKSETKIKKEIESTNNLEKAAFYKEAGLVTLSIKSLQKELKQIKKENELFETISLESVRLLIAIEQYEVAKSYLDLIDENQSSKSELLAWIYFGEKNYRKAKVEARKALKKNKTDIFKKITILNFLGQITLREARYDEACQFFKESFDLENQISKKDCLEFGNNHLGLVLHYMGKNDEAILFYQTRIKQFENKSDYDEIQLLSHLGTIYLNNSCWLEAMSLLKKAVLKVQQSGLDDHLTDYLDNALMTFNWESRYKDSIELIEQVIGYQKKFGLLKDLSKNYIKKAQLLLQLGQNESALDIIRKARKLSYKMRWPQIEAWFDMLEGFYYKNILNFEKAAHYFVLSYEKSLFIKDKFLEHWSLLGQTEICLSNGQVNKALTFLSQIPNILSDEELSLRVHLAKLKTQMNRSVNEHLLSSLKNLEEQATQDILWKLYLSWSRWELFRKNKRQSEKIGKKAKEVVQNISKSLPLKYQSEFNQHVKNYKNENINDLEKLSSNLSSNQTLAFTLAFDPQKSLEDYEKEIILKTLEFCHGNKSEAAKMLGISRLTLYNKIYRYEDNDVLK